MKTYELTDAALDWAVARCKHIPVRIMEVRGVKVVAFESNWNLAAYHDDWSQGGPIIEREGIELFRNKERDCWYGTQYGGPKSYGPTPLIAAMRCYVASKLGDDVNVPSELEAA